MHNQALKQLFLPFTLNSLAIQKGAGDHMECIGIIWSDGEVNCSGTGHAQIMIRKDKECTPAFLYQQIVNWLREKHKIHIEITPLGDEKDYPRYDFKLRTSWQSGIDYELKQLQKSYEQLIEESFETYQRALDKSIEEAFKLI